MQPKAPRSNMWTEMMIDYIAVLHILADPHAGILCSLLVHVGPQLLAAEHPEPAARTLLVLCGQTHLALPAN
jgi:hypothetical protein